MTATAVARKGASHPTCSFHSIPKVCHRVLARVHTLFCIVEAPDGETHYEKGMRGTFVVK